MSRASAAPPEFTIKAKRADDQVSIKREGDKTAIAIQSPYGISQATIERTGDSWPKSTLIRLQLKAMENLRVEIGPHTLQAAASVDGGMLTTRSWMTRPEDRLEVPLDRKSDYWLEITVAGEAEKRAITQPPQGPTAFEVTLPKALYELNPKSITISWIDFYRG